MYTRTNERTYVRACGYTFSLQFRLRACVASFVLVHCACIMWSHIVLVYRACVSYPSIVPLYRVGTPPERLLLFPLPIVLVLALLSPSPLCTLHLSASPRPSPSRLAPQGEPLNRQMPFYRFRPRSNSKHRLHGDGATLSRGHGGRQLGDRARPGVSLLARQHGHN